VNPERKGNILIILLAALITALVILEGYYVFVLRDRTEMLKDAASGISRQLHYLKSEKENLSDELTELRKMDTDDGNTVKR
jgi:hypothetical protein